MSPDPAATCQSGHRLTGVPPRVTGAPTTRQRSDPAGGAAWCRRSAIALCIVLALSLWAPVANAQERGGSGRGIGDPYFPSLGNAGYDVQHYDVELRIDPRNHRIQGTTTITLSPTARLRTMSLDFVGFTVSKVTVDRTAATFNRPSRKLRIKPRAALAAGETVTVVITYQGKPEKPIADTGWFWFKGGGALLNTQPAGARMLFPCNDHPRDKATFTFDLSTPRGVTAVANGLPTTRPAARGWERVVWREPGSFPTYAAVVAVGKLKLVRERTANGLPIINALPPKHAARLTHRLRDQGEIVAVLEEYFGPYPYSSIGAIVVPGAVDAMEAASRPTYPGVNWALSGSGFQQTVAHEIAHQWLGNDVSFRSWRDIWLSEGLATYGELLWIAHQRNVPISSLFKRNSDVFSYVRSMNRVPPGNPGPARIFDTSVYNRGALTLEALRRTVGDEAFYTIMRRWVTRYGGGNATTQQFIRLAESVSGQELDGFFQRWLYQRRLPTLPGDPMAQADTGAVDTGPAGRDEQAAPRPRPSSRPEDPTARR